MICNPANAFAHEEILRSCRHHLVLWDQFRRMSDEPRRRLIHLYRELMSDGHTVILDNGAHEGVIPLDSSYAELAKELGPTILVLPDLVGVDSKLSFLKGLSFYCNHCWDLPEETRFMIAGQGDGPHAVVLAYCDIYARMSPERFIVGLGQSYLQFTSVEGRLTKETELTRAALVSDLQLKSPHRMDEFEHHFLGGRWADPQHIGSAFSKVIGLDSIKPLTCAMLGVDYDGKTVHRSSDHRFDPRNSEMVVNASAWNDQIEIFCNMYGLER